MNTVKDAVIITGVGVAALAFFGWPVLLAWRARRWPVVEGEVLDAEIVRSGSKSTRFRVRARYAYRIGSQDFSSERVSFFSMAMLHRSRDSAAEQLQKYARGSRVQLRYDPATPDQAVIDTRVPWGFYFALAMSTLFVAGGISVLVRLSM